MKLTKETVKFVGVGTILVDEGYETEIIGMREERNHIYVTAKCISSPISWMPGRVTYGSPIGKYYGTEIKKGTEKMKVKMYFEEGEKTMFEKEGKAYHFTDENEWYYITEMMDDEKRERVHCKMAPCTNEEFMIAYLAEDPDFESLLWTEFRISYNG